MSDSDTIVAQVTCPGKGAVGILRISGSKAGQVAIAVIGKKLRPRFATYATFLDRRKQIIDKGIALWFPAPFSFTGEDVLELQGHGSPLIIDLLTQSILSVQCVRIAKPGEFSERAFFNGKMDLVQAEAIDDLINSETEASVKSALNSLQGVFSNHIQELMKTITSLRVNIETSIDFSEDVHIDLENIVLSHMKILSYQFKKVKAIATEGHLLKEGKTIVIAGLPNAGKSSLFNALSHSDRAIVTPVSGTTRDLLDAHVNIDGIPIRIIDTAGLRESSDTVEKIGIQRARDTIQQSDHVLFVIDGTTSLVNQKKICSDFIKSCSDRIKITFILNKNDLLKYEYGIKKIEGFDFIRLSAHTGMGIDILRNYLMHKENKKYQEGIFTARRRHLNQLDLSYSELVLAKKHWISFKNIECLSASLSLINKLLSQIIGQFTSDDLLDQIFSNFCIGK